MGRAVSVAATARFCIAQIVNQYGGFQAVAALEPKLLRRLIKKQFLSGGGVQVRKRAMHLSAMRKANRPEVPQVDLVEAVQVDVEKGSECTP